MASAAPSASAKRAPRASRERASASAAKKSTIWTTDGKPPIIIWYLNAHGAMNDQAVNPSVNEDKNTGTMVVSGYSIAGNQNQCGLMGKLKGIPEREGEHYEFNGKGIDYCIPSLMRKIFYDCVQKGLDTDRSFSTSVVQINMLYHHAGVYSELFANGGFKPMDHPTRFHFYQLYANPGENKRTSGKQSMRSAARGDIKYSEANLYGVWVVHTNIKVIQQSLSLTSIRNDKLSRHEENKGKGRPPNHLFLPPELLNPVNMAGRKNKTPTGAARWIRKLENLARNYGDLTPGGEIRRSCRDAIVMLDNMWKTRKTNLHDILDIFTPFHLVGEQLTGEPTTVRTIDVTCRSNIGKLAPPDPGATPPPAAYMLESQESYAGGIWVPASGAGAAAVAYDTDDTDDTDDDSEWYTTDDESDEDDMGSEGGGAKRKYSRKRNTRTRNRYTRRRTRRYTRRRRRTPR